MVHSPNTNRTIRFVVERFMYLKSSILYCRFCSGSMLSLANYTATARSCRFTDGWKQFKQSKLLKHQRKDISIWSGVCFFRSYAQLESTPRIAVRLGARHSVFDSGKPSICFIETLAFKSISDHYHYDFCAGVILRWISVSWYRSARAFHHWKRSETV